jgi:2-hydroxy-6-oxonona-2,4-dienedioate hydrolase
MEHPVIEEGKFKYLETGGEGRETLMLLHGLMGGLSNFQGVINHFSKQYNVVVPHLPLYDLPIIQVSVQGFVDYVSDFVAYKGYDKVHVLGNSLGGHVTLLYALAHPERIRSITLTGSSGLYESAMGTTFPRRGDYDYIKTKAQETFFNPDMATKELVDEIFSIVNDRNKAIRVVATSKSAVRHNIGDKLHLIKAPTLLIWGRQDAVTPLFVGEKFHELIEHSRLHIVEECGHAPMMEKPEEFNTILKEFMSSVGK